MPGKVEVIQGADDLGVFALALAAEGWLTEKDLEGATHLLPPVTAAIDRWCRKCTADLHLKVRLLFTDDWPSHCGNTLCENMDSDGGGEGLLDKKGAFLFDVTDSCADLAIIGPRLTALELHCPGLGRSVGRILQQVLGTLVHAYGPEDAYDDCANWNWGGEHDHKNKLEEIMDEVGYTEGDASYEPFHTDQAICGSALVVLEWRHGEYHFREEFSVDFKPKWDVRTVWIDSFDFSEYLITKDQLNEDLPEWSHAFTEKVFSFDRMHAAGRKLPRDETRLKSIVHCASILWRDFRRFKTLDCHFSFYIIGQSPGPLVLGWKDEGDAVARFYDDRCRLAGECGEYTDTCNLWVFAMDDAKTCTRMIRNITQAFALLEQAEQLLCLVATKFYRNKGD